MKLWTSGKRESCARFKASRYIVTSFSTRIPVGHKRRPRNDSDYPDLCNRADERKLNAL